MYENKASTVPGIPQWIHLVHPLERIWILVVSTTVRVQTPSNASTEKSRRHLPKAAIFAVVPIWFGRKSALKYSKFLVVGYIVLRVHCSGSGYFLYFVSYLLRILTPHVLGWQIK